MGFLGDKLRSVRRNVYFKSHKEDMLQLSWKNLFNLTQKIEILTSIYNMCGGCLKPWVCTQFTVLRMLLNLCEMCFTCYISLSIYA